MMHKGLYSTQQHFGFWEQVRLSNPNFFDFLCMQMTCQLLGVILEESSPEELQV